MSATEKAELKNNSILLCLMAKRVRQGYLNNPSVKRYKYTGQGLKIDSNK